MGACTSSHSSSSSPATAKLILPDGRLQEFLHPTRVCDVLRHHPSTFICNSDEMDFDDAVSAVDHHHLLHPGQLYFALPLKRLNHPLQPEEMAALAVMASAALAKCGGHRRCTDMFATEKRRVVRGGSRVADVGTVGFGRRCGGGGGGGSGGGGGGGGGGGKRGSFKVMLSAIPE